MVGELPDALDDGEGLLDGIEVWRVFGQWQQAMAMRLQQGFDLRLVMKGRVIHDDEGIGPEFFDQRLFNSSGDDFVRAATFK